MLNIFKIKLQPSAGTNSAELENKAHVPGYTVEGKQASLYLLNKNF